VLAYATALDQAVLARILIGLGDAVLFVSVLGLVPRWFPARRVPLITQLTTILGQLGQILSAVPFLMLPHLARTSNPRSNLGGAQSIVNMGGFLATLFVLAVMGTVMTVMGGFTPEAFRVAWLVLAGRGDWRADDAAPGPWPGGCLWRGSRPSRGDLGGLVSHPLTDQSAAVAAGPRTRTGNA
jgi:MFS family permease